MKKKVKNRWILLLACLASLFLLGGCSIRQSLDDVQKQYNLTAQVTYYANGGELSDTPERKDIYYKAGSKALDIGNVAPSSGKANITKQNYDFMGWYYAVLDEQGNPVYEDEASKTYKLGEKVDFTVPLQEGDHWQLVARWAKSVAVQVLLSVEQGATIVDADTAASYQNGSPLTTRNYDSFGRVDSLESNSGDVTAPFEAKDKSFTFVEYYANAECTEFVQWPIVRQEGQEADVVIYAKYIAGDWTIVRNATNAKDMFPWLALNKSFYLIRDIDMANEYAIAPCTQVNGIVEGNGFEIKNLKVERSQGNIERNEKVSLFGNIGATAKISNLKLTDLQISYPLKLLPVETYFVFTTRADGAQISGVTLSGKMTVLKPVGDGVLTAELFGDESKSEGFTVVGTKEEVIEIK